MSDKKSTAFSNGLAKMEPDGAVAMADPAIAGLGWPMRASAGPMRII
jgi:hypothetical protein